MAIAVIIMMYCIASFGILMEIDADFSMFNPIRNYRTWTSVNWFGVIVMTLLLNIIFLPYAIGYWIYKSFTIGRKPKT